MKYKIVSDSSSNLFALEQVEYANVPLKIITDEKEYVDEPGLDIPQMIEELKRTKSKSEPPAPMPMSGRKHLEMRMLYLQQQLQELFPAVMRQLCRPEKST